jgi:hypothetical protein
MEIKTIAENKEAFMDLLLLGDEQENIEKNILKEEKILLYMMVI